MMEERLTNNMKGKVIIHCFGKNDELLWKEEQELDCIYENTTKIHTLCIASENHTISKGDTIRFFIESVD